MSLARGPLSLKFNYFIAHAMFTPATVTREEHAQGNRCCSSSLNKNLSFLINRFRTNRLISSDNLAGVNAMLLVAPQDTK